MKVLGIAASPRRGGNSSTLMREALESARQAGAEVEEIHLAEEGLAFCTGCMSCLSGERCVQNDGLNEIREKMLAADGFILSCPTYAMAPSALMKNFIDRIGIWNAYRSALANKHIVSISTAGAAGASKTARTVANIADGFYGYGITSGILGAAVGHGGPDKYKPRARALGVKLVGDIRRHRRAPLAKLFDKALSMLVIRRVMWKNVMAHKTSTMKGVYEYWCATGRIQSD